MQTIKGTLNDLKITTVDSVEKTKKMAFSIDNNYIELKTDKCLNAKNGDEVIVAGVINRDRIFTAFSYKKIS